MDDYSFSAEVRRHWGIFLALTIALAVWCVVDVQRRARVVPGEPDLHKTDFTVYTEAGAAFFDGREPYEVSNVRGWRYLYPPLFALTMAPLHAYSPEAQVTVFFCLCVALSVGCYVECRKLAAAAWNRTNSLGWIDRFGRSHGTQEVSPIPQWLFILAFAAIAFPALNCLQRGQIGILKVYPLLLGFRLIMLGRSAREYFLGGILFSLPIALKVTPALPVSCVLFVLIVKALSQTGEKAKRLAWIAPMWGTGGTLLGCVLFLLVVPAGLIGWQANLQHLNTWYHKVVARADEVRSDDFGGEVDSPRNQSLFNAAYLFSLWVTSDQEEWERGRKRAEKEVLERPDLPDLPLVNRIVPVICGLALMILLVAAVRVGREAELTGQGAAFGLACVASLIVSPVSRGHYFVLLLPAVLFVPMWLLQRGRNRAAFWMAVIPVALSLFHYSFLEIAGRRGVMGICITLWFFAACAMLTKMTVAAPNEGRREETSSRRRGLAKAA